MATFQYQALNIHGQKIKGAIAAKTREQASSLLKFKKLQPISLRKQQFSWFHHNSSKTWTIDWCKDMGFFLGTGLPLVESLHASKLRLNKPQKQFIDNVLEGLFAGFPLSYVLGEYEMFPKLFIELLRIAESTGQYAEAFSDYASLKAEQAKFFRHLAQTMQYPIVLCIIILSMIIGFNEYLFPVVSEFFKSNNYEQNLFTRAFFQLSETMKMAFVFFTDLPLLIFVLLSLYFCSKIPKFKYGISILAIRWPIFGRIYTQSLQYFYLKSFSTLLKRGHHVLQAANYTTDIMQNIYFKRRAFRIEKAIQKEGKTSKAIATFLNLPTPLANLLIMGEAAAELAEYSDICAQILKNNCEERFRIILAWTGPILVSIIGIVMISMVIAIVVPLYDQIARLD